MATLRGASSLQRRGLHPACVAEASHSVVRWEGLCRRVHLLLRGRWPDSFPAISLTWVAALSVRVSRGRELLRSEWEGVMGRRPRGRRHRGLWVVRVGGASLLGSERAPCQVVCVHLALVDDSVPCRANIQRGGIREVVPDQHSPRPNHIRAMHESLSREMTGTARRRRTPMCVRDRG